MTSQRTHALCVGRDSELAQLAQLHRLAAQHGERLAVVEGPTGSGKSRLLEEFRNRVRLEGGVVLEGHCDPGRAFGPFAAVVDRALRFLHDLSITPSIRVEDLGCSGGCHRYWHEHDSADVPADPRDAWERRLRFFDAICGLIRDVGKVRTPVVVLHDLHRADEATLGLLSYIFEGAGPWSTGVAPERSVRALFVASVLTEAAESPRLTDLRAHEAATRIALANLDLEGVRQFLQSETAVRQVLERTGGLPERIELLLSARPRSAEELLKERLRSLSRGAQSLVEALAVLERPSGLELLSKVAGVDSPADQEAFAQSELVSRTLLDGRLSFSFTRDRFARLTYDGLSDERRAELHRRCVEVLIEQEQRGLAAHHALAAGDFERALDVALDDARALASRHAHAEAAALLERVLAQVPTASSEHRNYLADLYGLMGDYRRALVHAEAAQSSTPPTAGAAHRVGRLLTLAGRLDEASERLHDALTEARDEGTRTKVQTSLAELEYQRANYDEAERWARAALTDAHRAEDVPLELQARNVLGKVALSREEPSVAATHFEQNRDAALAAGLGHQHAQALTNLGVALLSQQRLAEAKRCFEQAIGIAEEVNDSRERAIATENLAVLAHLRRDYKEAQQHYHAAVALLQRLGNRAMLTGVGLNLGWLYLALGDRPRARSLSDFAQHMGGTDLPPLFAAECLLLRGQIDLADGHTDAARGALEASRDIFLELRSVKVIQPTLDLARLALDDGAVESARKLLASAPTPASPRRMAEHALVEVELARAAGENWFAAAQHALELARTADDEELLLEALLTFGGGICERDPAMASRILAEAQEIEAALTTRVPQDALPSWTARPARLKLADLEDRVASSSGRRLASTPPPRRRSDELDLRYPDIVGSGARTVQLLEILDKVAPSDATVLVRGESGTGKELVAEALHRHSPRRDRPLVKVNCAALVETLLLSELFGHERGAFTGANARKKGRFELANGGTLFLDEIGDISPATQVALLRVLQEREFERVGGTQPIKVDVRIIAATHRNLEEMVVEGTFREDLYYRLRGVCVEVPALRDRLEDIPDLVRHLLDAVAVERGESPKRASPDVLQMLSNHHWPGNVRELENVLRSATLFAEGDVLSRSDFAAFGDTFALTSTPSQPEESPSQPLEDTLYARIRDGETSLLEMKKVLERECIVRALGETGGNITRAAALLGMKRPRLSQLVKQYGLQVGTKKAHTRVQS